MVWPYIEWGGAQIILLGIIKEAKTEWEITVILPKNSSPDLLILLQTLEVKIHFISHHQLNTPAPSVREKIVRQYFRITAQMQIVRALSLHDLENSIVHIEAAPWQDWILLLTICLMGGTTFLTMYNFMPHSSRPRELIWRLRFAIVSRIPRFHIFAGNVDTRKRLLGWVSSKFLDDVKVVPAGVDPDEIRRVNRNDTAANDIRAQWGIKSSAFVVLTVGQFVDRKGRWILLEAAKRILRVDDDVFFVWVAQSLPCETDQTRIAGFGLEDRFRIVASNSVGVSREAILRVYKAADAFTLPSFIEGLPVALLEAMALGVPSISTSVFAIPEAIKDEETGLLIEAGRPDALANAILRLRFDEGLRSSLAQNGREFVLNHFDEKIGARTAVASYREAFDRR